MGPRILAVLLAVIFLSAMAGAQGGNLYFGYTYANADVGLLDHNGMNGWTGSLEGKIFPFVGIVADISGQYGSQDNIGADTSLHTFLFGPRVSVSVAKFRPFAHVLVGIARSKINAPTLSDTDTSFATQAGGGVDYSVLGPLSWRFEGDYLRTSVFSNDQNDFRFTTGIVLHF
jgi:opacity protein-like surface antigen